MLHWISSTCLITMSQFYNQKKNPSQSHQSETQKNQCYLLLYINWLKPKTQQAKRNVEWIDFGIKRERLTRESDRAFWRRWASSAGWLVLVNCMGLSPLMVFFNFCFGFMSLSQVLKVLFWATKYIDLKSNSSKWISLVGGFCFLVTRKFH